MIHFPAQSTTSVLWLLLVQPTRQPSIPAFPCLLFQTLLLQEWGFTQQLLQVCTASLSQLTDAWLMSKPCTAREERVRGT